MQQAKKDKDPLRILMHAGRTARAATATVAATGPAPHPPPPLACSRPSSLHGLQTLSQLHGWDWGRAWQWWQPQRSPLRPCTRPSLQRRGGEQTSSEPTPALACPSFAQPPWHRMRTCASFVVQLLKLRGGSVDGRSQEQGRRGGKHDAQELGLNARFLKKGLHPLLKGVYVSWPLCMQVCSAARSIGARPGYFAVASRVYCCVYC